MQQTIKNNVWQCGRVIEKEMENIPRNTFKILGAKEAETASNGAVYRKVKMRDIQTNEVIKLHVFKANQWKGRVWKGKYVQFPKLRKSVRNGFISYDVSLDQPYMVHDDIGFIVDNPLPLSDDEYMD